MDLAHNSLKLSQYGACIMIADHCTLIITNGTLELAGLYRLESFVYFGFGSQILVDSSVKIIRFPFYLTHKSSSVSNSIDFKDTINSVNLVTNKVSTIKPYLITFKTNLIISLPSDHDLLVVLVDQLEVSLTLIPIPFFKWKELTFSTEAFSITYNSSHILKPLLVKGQLLLDVPFRMKFTFSDIDYTFPSSAIRFILYQYVAIHKIITSLHPINVSTYTAVQFALDIQWLSSLDTKHELCSWCNINVANAIYDTNWCELCGTGYSIVSIPQLTLFAPFIEAKFISDLGNMINFKLNKGLTVINDQITASLEFKFNVTAYLFNNLCGMWEPLLEYGQVSLTYNYTKFHYGINFEVLEIVLAPHFLPQLMSFSSLLNLTLLNDKKRNIICINQCIFEITCRELVLTLGSMQVVTSSTDNLNNVTIEYVSTSRHIKNISLVLPGFYQIGSELIQISLTNDYILLTIMHIYNKNRIILVDSNIPECIHIAGLGCLLPKKTLSFTSLLDYNHIIQISMLLSKNTPDDQPHLCSNMLDATTYMTWRELFNKGFATIKCTTDISNLNGYFLSLSVKDDGVKLNIPVFRISINGTYKLINQLAIVIYLNILNQMSYYLIVISNQVKVAIFTK